MNILEQNFLNKEKKKFVLLNTVYKTKTKQNKRESLLKEVALFPMNACQLPK